MGVTWGGGSSRRLLCLGLGLTRLGGGLNVRWMLLHLAGRGGLHSWMLWEPRMLLHHTGLLLWRTNMGWSLGAHSNGWPCSWGHGRTCCLRILVRRNGCSRAVDREALVLEMW